MKLLTVLFCTVALSSAAITGRFFSKEFPAARIDDEHLLNGTFITRLDHFRPLDERNIDFLYHVNSEHYRPGGPLYIYIKDTIEGNRWIEEGLMVDIASENGAALFTLDHRYAGHNRFTDLTVEDLEHLTVEQALQDIATLVQDLRTSNSPSSVILYGSGFGATLAVWARKKFPHLINGVWASSGIFAISPLTYSVYDELEETFLATRDVECRDLIREAFEEIERIVVEETGAGLNDLFELCAPLDTTDQLEIFAFYETLYYLLINYINTFDGHAVINICRDIRALPGNPLGSFARWLNFVYPRQECLDQTYASFVERNLDHLSAAGTRPWLYLQCTQIGTFLVADGYTWLPDIPYSYHIQKCADVFGEDFSETAFTNANRGLRRSFGSLEQHVTSVIYTNGELDPWRGNGILSSSIWDTFVFDLEQQSKSSDLTTISGLDSAGLVAAKQEIREIINRWSTNPLD